MEVLAVLFITTLVKKVGDFIKFVRANDISSIVMQVLSWAGGVGATVLVAHADIFSHFALQGFVLSRANGASQVIVGLMFGSGASTLADVVKAVDTNEPTTPPALIP